MSEGLLVEGLTKSYGGVVVMDGVDLAVPPGRIHALLGANGAGKSTLIKCVSGAVTPDSGEITVGTTTARAHSPRSARAAGVAVIYQDFSVATSLNVTENVFLGQELRKGPFVRHADQRRRTAELLDSLGADLDPDGSLDLVGGAGLQLIEIMKALVAEPAVLILDEPTAALDAEAEHAVFQRFRDLSQGRTTLLISHRFSTTRMADRILVIEGGRIVEDGAHAELLQAGARYAHLFQLQAQGYQ
jgi:ribose transport system ATP-binding protein